MSTERDQRAPWCEPKDPALGGHPTAADRVASLLERLNEAAEYWLDQEVAKRQRSLIENNIRVQAAQHPNLASAFTLPPA